MHRIALCAAAALLAVAVGLASGCASKKPPRTLGDEVGVLTYDEALRMWGPPNQHQKGENLEVAVWERHHGEDYVQEIMVWFDEAGRMMEYKSTVWEVNDQGKRTIVTRDDLDYVDPQ